MMTEIQDLDGVPEKDVLLRKTNIKKDLAKPLHGSPKSDVRTLPTPKCLNKPSPGLNGPVVKF